MEVSMKVKSVMLIVLAFGLVVTSMSQGIKPVSRVRAYNGTYSGGPYSGSVGYSTLYRDNQDNGSKSGCRGEGCGRHPGVDIATSSGTEVLAAFSGTVMISRCDTAWGGLIVIKSNHPQRPWETIFHAYAHLKLRTYQNGLPVNVGDYVNSGTVIARSGGGASDPCRGNSSGSHLHFQIDKDDGNPEPYYPSQSLLNTKDDAFFVAGKTYNPMLMVGGGYRWKFNQSGNRELWDLYNFQSWGVADNALWVDADFDPYIRRGSLTNCGLSKPCSSFLSAEASDYKSIYLDLFNTCSVIGGGKIYFTTKEENFWSEDKTIFYYPPVNGNYNSVIYAGTNPKWTSVITGLRIDPSESCNAYGFDPTYYGEIALVP